MQLHDLYKKQNKNLILIVNGSTRNTILQFVIISSAALLL